MCIPLATAIPLALTAISTVAQIGSMAAQNKAAKRDESKRNEALLAERLRQQEYKRRAEEQHATVLQNMRETPKSGREEAEANLSSVLQGAVGDPMPVGGHLASTPGAIVADVAAKSAEGTGQAKAEAERRARVKALDQAMFNQGMANRKPNILLGLINDDADQSQQLLQPELQQANHAGDGLRTFGQILGVGSDLAAAGAMTYGGATSSSTAKPKVRLTKQR